MIRSRIATIASHRMVSIGLMALVLPATGCVFTGMEPDYPAPFVHSKRVITGYSPMDVGVAGEADVRVGHNREVLDIGHMRNSRSIGTNNTRLRVGRDRAASVDFGQAGRSARAGVHTISQMRVGHSDNDATSVGHADGERRAIAYPYP